MDARAFNVRTKDNKVVKWTRPGRKMSVKEFEQWLDGMDANGDGVITKSELKAALKRAGARFTNWKANQAMASADVNDNGIIDSDMELKDVIEYAQKNWGLSSTRMMTSSQFIHSCPGD